MKYGSEASSSAKFALSVLDEKTGFKGFMPTNSREYQDVLDQVHHFEGVEKDQQARRWWTDCAPEFRAASRAIRKLRPLAHFTSIPRRATSNAIIERSNRTVGEGTNASLFTAGMDSKWWVCAGPHWVATYSGFHKNKDGQTAWLLRHKEDCLFIDYPWGALVFVKPLEKQSKFTLKMTPRILVGVGIGPGFSWNKEKDI